MQHNAELYRLHRLSDQYLLSDQLEVWQSAYDPDELQLANKIYHCFLHQPKLKKKKF